MELSNAFKLAIPLLGNGIEYEDINENKGFVGGYFIDNNRPYLDRHLFLLYRTTTDKVGDVSVHYKLREFNNLYSWKVIHIKGIAYTLYTFTCTKAQNHLRDGRVLLSLKNKTDVLNFWQSRDAWISNNVLLGTLYVEPDNRSVPEEDYYPEEDWLSKIKGELLKSSSPFLFGLSLTTIIIDSFEFMIQYTRINQKL